MRVPRAIGPAIAVCLSLGGGIAEAAPADGIRQSASLEFDQKSPGTPTGVSFDIDYVNPDDAEAKPIPVRTITAVLAEGTQVDTSVPEQCTAADAQLMLLGPDVCPAGSRVGIGYVRIDTGFEGSSRFIENDLVLFNRTGQLIFLFTDRGTGARLVSRCPIEGLRITCSAPPLPGTLPDGAAVDVVHEELFEVTQTAGGARRGYVTTPGECSPGRDWANLAIFGYADGVSQTVETTSACSTEGGKSGRCVNDWNGSNKNDRHAGTEDGDQLFGFGGNDRLKGRRGDDCVYGHTGDDKLRGGAGDDRLSGAAGNDRLVGGPGSDVLLGGRGPDAVVARDGEADRVRCGEGRDTIVTADVVDQLIGC
jgi:hypothetical protein